MRKSVKIENRFLSKRTIRRDGVVGVWKRNIVFYSFDQFYLCIYFVNVRSAKGFSRSTSFLPTKLMFFPRNEFIRKINHVRGDVIFNTCTEYLKRLGVCRRDLCPALDINCNRLQKCVPLLWNEKQIKKFRLTIENSRGTRHRFSTFQFSKRGFFYRNAQSTDSTDFQRHQYAVSFSCKYTQ